MNLILDFLFEIEPAALMMAETPVFMRLSSFHRQKGVLVLQNRLPAVKFRRIRAEQGDSRLELSPGNFGGLTGYNLSRNNSRSPHQRSQP